MIKAMTRLLGLCDHTYRRVEEHGAGAKVIYSIRCHDCGKVLLNPDDYYVAKELIVEREDK